MRIHVLTLGALLLAPSASDAKPFDPTGYAGSWAFDAAGCARPAFTITIVDAGDVKLETTVDGEPIGTELAEYDENASFLILDPLVAIDFHLQDGEMTLSASGGGKKHDLAGLAIKNPTKASLVRCSSPVAPVGTLIAAATPAPAGSIPASATTAPSPAASVTPDALASTPVDPKTIDGYVAARKQHQATFGPSWFTDGSYGEVTADEDGPGGHPGNWAGVTTACEKEGTAYSISNGSTGVRSTRWTAPDGTVVKLQGKFTIYTGADGRRYVKAAPDTPVPLEFFEPEVAGAVGFTMPRGVSWSKDTERVVVTVSDSFPTHHLDASGRWSQILGGLSVPDQVDATYFVLKVQGGQTAVLVTRCEE